MPHLFDELKLRGVTLRNRLGITPMCMYWSDEGLASDWHLTHLGSRAVGGAGLVFVEATAVEAIGRITPKDMGIWIDAHVDPLARVARFVAEYGALPAIQLAHAGRKASTAPPYDDHSGRTLDDSEGGWEPVAPSPVPFHPGGRTPRELTIPDIRAIQDAFVVCTRRALKAGFRLVELHAAHGYLAHSFHSPLSNRRTDEYGGSFENRTRFTLETARLMRAEWPDDLPMAVRLSATDWADGGWTLEESIELSRRLKAAGVDLIDCSSDALVPGVKYPAGPSWQVPLAEAIRKGAGIPTAAVGVITDPAQADEIVANGRADLVLIGKASLLDAYWPYHAAKALGQGDKVHLPAPYDYAV